MFVKSTDLLVHSRCADRKNFPINAGWRVQQCDMSPQQMHNFSLRCRLQLESNQVHNSCELARMMQDARTREKAYKALRVAQSAATQCWGSDSSGLQQLLKGSCPDLESVGKFAPKVRKLCETVMEDGGDTALRRKHFVYSAYTGTITCLSKTLDALRSEHGTPVFKQLSADDFEWHGRSLKLKSKPCSEVCSDANVIVFVVLKGNVEEKRKLKAAFGFVTPDGERYDGLLRVGSGYGTEQIPLVQVMMGARETNQGLTFLKLQHIHIMEPNPRGWGQIVQTIGRGIRRGTHKGLADENLRTVRTTIYVTNLAEGWLEATTEQQIGEVTESLSSEHENFHQTYHLLKETESRIGVTADPSLGLKTAWKKRVDALKKNMRIIAKNIQKLSSDKAMVCDI